MKNEECAVCLQIQKCPYKQRRQTNEAPTCSEYKPCDEKSYLEIRDLVQKAAKAYYDEDEPIFSDAVYDSYIQIMRAYEMLHPEKKEGSPTQVVGGSAGNISDCLYGSGNTEDTWFVDELGDLRCRSAHHDGTNLLLYRVYKPNVSDTQKQNFKEKILSGQLTRADINRITLRLGDWISDVYGFKIPRKKATASTAA